MKRVFNVLMIACVLSISLSAVAHAGETTPPPDTSSPELQRIKSLAGKWSSVTSMFGKKDERVFTEYKVTAGGSAIEERIFPGTPQEMVSMYYDDDNGKLAMTHYCIMRNRPTLKLASSTNDSITLHVDKVSGPKGTKKNSMGDIELAFKDKDHFSATCGHKGKGKDASPPMTMEYTRVGK